MAGDSCSYWSRFGRDAHGGVIDLTDSSLKHVFEVSPSHPAATLSRQCRNGGFTDKINSSFGIDEHLSFLPGRSSLLLTVWTILLQMLHPLFMYSYSSYWIYDEYVSYMFCFLPLGPVLSYLWWRKDTKKTAAQPQRLSLMFLTETLFFFCSGKPVNTVVNTC